MTADDAALLAALPTWAFAFMLVLSRVSAAVMVMPGLGEAEIPAPVRAALALAITVLLLPTIAPLLPPPPGQVWQAGGMVGAELLTGIVLGWLARLLVLALPAAGQLMSFQIGLANVLQVDMSEGMQTSVLSRMFGLAAPLIILISGLYVLPLQALAGSYRVIVAGSLLPAGDVTETMISAVAATFALALRLAAPFIVAGLVWQVAVGLLSRLVSALQIFLIVMPGQILGGLLLLSALFAAVIGAWTQALQAGLALLPGMR